MSFLDAQRIVAETSIRHVEQRHELVSTHDLAIALAEQPYPLPLLVAAELQTGGRGRGANTWWADKGALTFSLLLDAEAYELARQHWPKVSLTAGLAVCEVLESLLPKHCARLKWPNDVYLEGRKVCGILVDNLARHPSRLVMGIGLNVNNSIDRAPPELRELATSLVDHARRAFDLTEILIRLLQRLDARIASVGEGREELSQCWQRRCMLEGRTVTVQSGQRRVTGVCRGIDHNGALLLQSESGIERCLAGVVASIL